VARSIYNNKVMIYSLDRIHTLDILANEKFKMPDSFNPTQFFSEYYGVIVDEEQTIEKVTIKVSSAQANYLRSLPMHHSQQEIERTNEFSIFQIVIKPTYDFQQEILKNGEDIEVLEPSWFRTEISNRIKQMSNKYND
jgi:predicted DNA-binding transcriptional regulator YafY